MLHKKILKAGAGEHPPSEGTHTMVMHYTGTLTDGTPFDSSKNPGRGPFEFCLGARQVIHIIHVERERRQPQTG
jgi:FKBP-type peptidyl-prolyl cis-trans isomerase